MKDSTTTGYVFSASKVVTGITALGVSLPCVRGGFARRSEFSSLNFAVLAWYDRHNLKSRRR